MDFIKVLFFIFITREVHAQFADVSELVFPLENPDDYSPEYSIIKAQLNISFSIEDSIRRVRNATTYQERQKSNQFQVFDFIGLVQQYEGYVAEEHTVTTVDGYNLILHRIPRSNTPQISNQTQVVFIQHGLFLSSDAFVLQGPNKDLAFRLADKGYDVWFGNARGNTYSRSHKFYNPNHNDFWRFSFDEVGRIDFKYSIDYILSVTKTSCLTIIGYSIGATESYVFLSEHPEYNDKVNLLISVSPLGFWSRPTPEEKEKIYGIAKQIDLVRKKTHKEEMYPLTSFTQQFWKNLCSPDNDQESQDVCDFVVNSFFGSMNTTYEKDLIKRIMQYIPAGTSAKTLLHLLQTMDHGTFKKYEPKIGTAKNYNLTAITVPTAIFSACNDQFVIQKDCATLKASIPNSVIFKLFKNETVKIDYLDLLWHEDIDMINDSILKLL
ncbi:hypothetical protein TKK_0009294 [Trichogramma kaykai]